MLVTPEKITEPSLKSLDSDGSRTDEVISRPLFTVPVSLFYNLI